jgi:amidase
VYQTDVKAAFATALARGARDLALALEAMGGPAGAGAVAWSWRLPRPRHTRLRDFRIGT